MEDEQPAHEQLPDEVANTLDADDLIRLFNRWVQDIVNRQDPHAGSRPNIPGNYLYRRDVFSPRGLYQTFILSSDPQMWVLLTSRPPNR
jgi:hypothetical protein